VRQNLSKETFSKLFRFASYFNRKSFFVIEHAGAVRLPEVLQKALRSGSLFLFLGYSVFKGQLFKLYQHVLWIPKNFRKMNEMLIITALFAYPCPFPCGRDKADYRHSTPPCQGFF
jgi:hypothetical protein